MNVLSTPISNLYSTVQTSSNKCNTYETLDNESANYGCDYNKFYGHIFLRDGTMVSFNVDTQQSGDINESILTNCKYLNLYASTITNLNITHLGNLRVLIIFGSKIRKANFSTLHKLELIICDQK